MLRLGRSSLVKMALIEGFSECTRQEIIERYYVLDMYHSKNIPLRTFCSPRNLVVCRRSESPDLSSDS